MDTSPNYGPAGKPSQGRIVRLHFSAHTKCTTPATILDVDPDTGDAHLAFDLVSGSKITREHSIDVPFGEQSDPDLFFWDYYPRVWRSVS